VMTTLIAEIADLRQFKNGRELADRLNLFARNYQVASESYCSASASRYLRTSRLHGVRAGCRVAEQKRGT
jgi:hypothetical protein